MVHTKRRGEDRLPPNLKPGASLITSKKTWKKDPKKAEGRRKQMEYILSKSDDPNLTAVFVNPVTGKVVETSKADLEKQKREKERLKLVAKKRAAVERKYRGRDTEEDAWKKERDMRSATSWQNPLALVEEEKSQNTQERSKDPGSLATTQKGKTWNNNFVADGKAEDRKKWVNQKDKSDAFVERVDQMAEAIEEKQEEKKVTKEERVKRAIPQPRLWSAGEQPKKDKFGKRKLENKWESNKKPRTEPEVRKFDSKGKPIPIKGKSDGKDFKAKKDEKEEKEDRLTHKVSKAKLIWEQARIKEKKPNERQDLIDKLMKIIGEDIKGFIYKHDGSRILQTCLKYGSLDQRKKLLSEMLPEVLTIAQHEFSHFLAIKIFKYSDHQNRMHFLTKIQGQVLRIFKFKFGAKIIEKVYEYGSSRAKHSILAEFYGREFALFKQNDNAKNLKDILKTCTPEKQQKILAGIKDNLVSMLSSKGEVLVPHTVLHKVIWEYLSNADPKGITEIVSLLESLLLLFIHTHEGAKCGAYCFLYGNAKERKSMLKSLKDHVQTIATSPYAYLVILAALARVDDTTNLTKFLYQPLLGSLAELALEPTSARILLIAFAAPSLRHFTQEEMSFIELDAKVPQEGNPENMVSTSMKDPALRRKQLTEYLAPPLAEACVARVMELMVSKSGADVLFEVIKAGRYEALRAVIDIIERSETAPPKDEEKANGKKEGEEDEEEEEFYWTSKPSTSLLSRLLKELPEKEKAELLEKLVASFGDNILHWAVKSSNASYLIKDILLHADKNTQQKLAKQLASVAPDTRVGRAVAEITSKTTSNGVNGKETKAVGKKAAAKKEQPTQKVVEEAPKKRVTKKPAK